MGSNIHEIRWPFVTVPLKKWQLTTQNRWMPFFLQTRRGRHTFSLQVSSIWLAASWHSPCTRAFVFWNRRSTEQTIQVDRRSDLSWSGAVPPYFCQSIAPAWIRLYVSFPWINVCNLKTFFWSKAFSYSCVCHVRHPSTGCPSDKYAYFSRERPL